MYPQEINPKCCALSNPGNEPILDGDTKRILEICNDGNVKETKELILIVPERKLDGYVPPHASPLYEDDDFIAQTVKLLEDHDDYDGEDCMPFEGMIYHIKVIGFVCKVLDSLTIKE